MRLYCGADRVFAADGHCVFVSRQWCFTSPVDLGVALAGPGLLRTPLSLGLLSQATEDCSASCESLTRDGSCLVDGERTGKMIGFDAQ